jgi:hypothetical protein
MVILARQDGLEKLVKIDNYRWLRSIVLLITGRGVDELHAELVVDPVTAMDVAKDMEF